MTYGQGWPMAAVKAVAVVAYFAIATVWFPSWLLGSTLVSGTASLVQDTIGTGVWLVLLAVGMWGLRWLQTRGWV